MGSECQCSGVKKSMNTEEVQPVMTVSWLQGSSHRNGMRRSRTNTEGVQYVPVCHGPLDQHGPLDHLRPASKPKGRIGLVQESRTLGVQSYLHPLTKETNDNQ